ncbi:MAG TPA: hypothetical protein VHQ65_13930 [Thermoanaerobaculia bacterium]|nr:hypothetical protein [Thermoanaerobaculia bacterium]
MDPGERLGDADLRRHEHLHPAAGGERQLVLAGEVSGVGHGDVEAVAVGAERHRPPAHRQLAGQQRSDLLRHPEQLLGARGLDPVLLGQADPQQLLGEGTLVEQAGAQAAAEQALGLQRLGEVGAGDPAVRQQQLSQPALHVVVASPFDGGSNKSLFANDLSRASGL